jgi:shikimate dehydrogenase
VTHDRLTFHFVGVTTGQSSINAIFPAWMEALGRPEVLVEGVDLRLHDSADAYRAVVERIKRDPRSPGGLVTTHKIDLFDAARDLFDFVDPFAQALGEVSCISKSSRGLEGYAKDPITAGLSLDWMLGPGYFGRTGGAVLCFGAGGSAASIAAHFVQRRGGDRPQRFVVVNRSQPRLDRLQSSIKNLAGQGALNLEPICNEDPIRNDEILAAMPSGSLVVNATGMGKDRPGSPISDEALLPEASIAWELNYRGELRFLHQARAQPTRRRVRAEDGWQYFLHGWAEHIAQVLNLDISPERFARLAEIAADAAPASR